MPALFAGVAVVRTFSIPDGSEIGSAVQLELPPGSEPRAVTDDGIYLAAGPELSAARVADGSAVTPPFAPEHGVAELRFSADRTYLFLTRPDGTIEVRRNRTWEVVQIIVGPEPPVNGQGTPVLADRTRGLILSAAPRGHRLFDLRTGAQIGDRFPHDSTYVVVFPAESASGPLQLATVVGDRIHIWNLATENWYDIACQAAGRNMTRDEWDRVGPQDTDYTATCPQWPADA